LSADVGSAIIKIINRGQFELTLALFAFSAHSSAPSWPLWRKVAVTRLPAGPTHCHSVVPTIPSALFFSGFCHSQALKDGTYLSLNDPMSSGCSTFSFSWRFSKILHFCWWLWTGVVMRGWFL